MITCKKLAADDRADISQKHGCPLASSGRREIMVPRCSIIVRAVVPIGMADTPQSTGQIRANVCLLCEPDNARIAHESD